HNAPPRGDYLHFFLRKSADEATREAEAAPVDEMSDGEPMPPDEMTADKSTKHSPRTVDVGDSRMTFPNERALAVWLAIQERGPKSTEDPNHMSTPESKLRDIAKREGVHVTCKIMVADQRSYGITQD